MRALVADGRGPHRGVGAVAGTVGSGAPAHHARYCAPRGGRLVHAVGSGLRLSRVRPGAGPPRHARPRRVARLLPLLPALGLALALALGPDADPARAGRFLEGRVVKVFDGDTIEILVDGRPRRIRLAGIDTPERGQPWAERAKQALAGRVFGKEVRVNEVAIDRYGRTVGEVYADGVCVGCELVREGHAWVYRHFSHDPVLLELEAEARAGRRGLWQLPEAQRVPPWEWRHLRSDVPDRDGPDRGGRDRPDGGRASEAPAFSCGPRRSCREMSSCAEARFQLEQCGRAALDGDGDGVPCEALCRSR
jgi:endonuclease YncB( thermonuclease family)